VVSIVFFPGGVVGQGCLFPFFLFFLVLVSGEGLASLFLPVLW